MRMWIPLALVVGLAACQAGGGVTVQPSPRASAAPYPFQGFSPPPFPDDAAMHVYGFRGGLVAPDPSQPDHFTWTIAADGSASSDTGGSAKLDAALTARLFADIMLATPVPPSGAPACADGPGEGYYAYYRGTFQTNVNCGYITLTAALSRDLDEVKKALQP